MYFDTHTHVNDEAFKDDQDDTIKRALAAQTWMINVGTGFENSKSAIELAKKFPTGVFASVGLHPTENEIFDEAQYKTLLSDKVVAVGECGLDYFRLSENKEAGVKKQKIEFVKQLHFAQENKLPIIIHCRDLPTGQVGAYPDLIDIVRNEYKDLPGVIHSFTDSWDIAKKFLDMGFYIAFNGILTFDKTGRLAEVVEKSPMDRLVIETDAPYLTPPPYRGKRNEPSYVQYVAAEVGKIKKMTPEQIGLLTFENAVNLFGIKK